MPSLEEAMRQSEDSIEQLDDGLITPVNDVFMINPETRIIEVPESERLFGVNFDKDVEKGKLYRKVKRINLKDFSNERVTHGFHSNGNGYLSYPIIGKRDSKPISNLYIGSKWTNESGYVYIPNDSSIVFVDDRFTDKETAIKLVQDTYAIYELSSQTEEDLSIEQIKSLKLLSTYYPVTNITVGSEQLDGYTVFNYPISMENGWNYVKQQLNDNRDYIYDMDLQSAEAYVNSEYAVTLTELEV